MKNKLTKCSFCAYATNTGCMVTPNSSYCKKATEEYYAYTKKSNYAHVPARSLRKWDKR